MDVRAPLVTEWGEPQESEWASAARHARESGLPIHDLINASPLEHGLGYPDSLLQSIFANAHEALQRYAPDPRGTLDARESVAQYHCAGTRADAVILTPGTSTSYYYAFRTLTGAGDEILCPSPTYPLFNDLAKLAGVGVRHYHLSPPKPGGAHWQLDLDDLAFQITSRTKSIVLVSPHNPTGTIISATEIAGVCDLARRHKLAIIFDEVFRESVHMPDNDVPRPSRFGAPLSITLNGLSKMVSLPGLKAGWMVVEGDTSEVKRFLSACEYISDTLLPVSEITQRLLPALLRTVTDVAPVLRHKLTARMHNFVEEWVKAGFEVVVPEAGPYLCIPLPENWLNHDTELAVRLANEGILVHAGSAYGLPFPALTTTCIATPPWPLARIAAAVFGLASR